MPAKAGIQLFTASYSELDLRLRGDERLSCADVQHRPYSLCGAGYAVVRFPPSPFGLRRGRPPASKKYRGRAGRQGSCRTRGPRRLAASRRAEVRITASPPSPKASRARCLLGLLRSAPGGLTIRQSRLSGQDEVVIGSPSANRGRAELEGLIGFFMNTLALRVDLSGSPRVAELLGRVKAVSLGAQSHQRPSLRAGGRDCAAAARPRRMRRCSRRCLPGRTRRKGCLNSPGLALSPVQSPHVVAKFDLLLSLGEEGEEIAGGVEYATRHCSSRETIGRYLGLYGGSCWRAWQPDDKPGHRQAAAFLSGAERDQVVYQWNATEADYPADECVHELFEAQAARTPDAVAVEFEDQRLSYSELNARANRLAHHLIGLGVKPDDRVAICVERSLEMVIGLLAILKAGGAYVPLDPAYPAARLSFMLKDSAPVGLIADSAGQAALTGCGIDAPVIDLGDAAQWANEPATNVDCAALGLTSRRLAYVIYTSGSTGSQRASWSSIGDVARLFAATNDLFQFGSEDVWTFAPILLTFQCGEVWGALLYGGSRVVPLNTASSPEDFYELVRHGVTVLNQTPSAFRQLITAQKESQARIDCVM